MKLVILGLVVPLLANALNCLKGVLSDLNNEISLQPVSIVACSSRFCKSVYQNDGFTIVYTLGCDVNNTCNAVESIADIGKSQRIACCNTDSCVHPDASKPVEYPLDNIAFSTATAAYQVEGAWNTSRGPSMWDIYVQRPNVIKNNDTGNDACKSYDFWQKDVDLLKSLGVKAYRFSISWGRIFPNGVDPAGNDAGVAYYKGLIKALKAANITPMVTMYHWDLPINFMDRGGWLNTDTAIAFGNYAKYLFNTFGDDVQDWIPINEPNSVIDFEYCGETHADAPGDFIPHCAWTRYLAAYNLLRAHLEAYRAYKSLNGAIKGWRLGIALNGPYCYPASENQTDIEASERCYQFNYGLLGHVLFSEKGDWAPAVKTRLDDLSKQEGRTMSRLPAFTQQEVEELRKSAHFLGVNYYLAATVKSNLADLPANRWNYLQQDYDSGSYTIPTNEWQMINASNGWIAYTPFGLRALLVKMNQEYPNVTIVITENGCMDTYDENLQDNTRIHYLRGHLMAIAQAKIADGVNIQGYTYWSLLDNFEWLDGYTTKFGLHRVDFNDPNRARTAKKSATFYTDTIKAKKLTGFAVDSRW